MPEPRPRRPHGARAAAAGRMAALGLVVMLGAGCTTSPHIAAGTLTDAKHRVLALVNDTGAAIGAPAQFAPARVADALPCYKKMLGYTVRHLGANQAEVPLQIPVAGSADGASLLERVARYWSSRGFTVDRGGLSDHRFPKVRAHAGNDLLVATGYVAILRINLYAVSPCVKG